MECAIFCALRSFFLVCAGGAVGTGARYLVATGMVRWVGSGLPWGTLTVNLVGSFLLAAILEAGLGFGLFSTELRLALATGVLGGFTTYSSFNSEALGYLGRGAFAQGFGYLVLTLAGCLAAGALGLGFVRWAMGGGIA